MAADESSHSELSNTGYEIFIGALSVLSLVNIVLLSLLRDEGLQTVVYAIDVLLSVVFLIDFLARLRRAPSRLDYVFRQFGWADLLASLPFPQVKILRVFRLIRVTRLLRRYGAGNIARSLIRDRAGTALLSLLFIAVLVQEFGSLTILHVEQGAPEANITTASDALWYVIVTMSTVGYGDVFPVSKVGQGESSGRSLSSSAWASSARSPATSPTSFWLPGRKHQSPRWCSPTRTRDTNFNS